MAYRLILRRPVDSDGLRSYSERAAAGLTLKELIEELFTSDEYRDKAAEPLTARTPPPESPTGLITPDEVMARYDLQELIETADEYYRRIPDPTPLLIKPLGFLNETPQILTNLGLLLSDLDLGKGMTVLDFGAGTGWLSRMLAQLNCRVIGCDVSGKALELAEETLRKLPLIGEEAHAPKFVVFDGRHIPIPDQSVDCVISFDAFHHVPNQREVLGEFARVLRPGGVVGFSEPGRHHSRSAQSQYEMKHHRVLENDVRLEDIFGHAKSVGFTDMKARLFGTKVVGLSDILAALDVDADRHQEVEAGMWETVKDAAESQSIFYLFKGSRVLDSRQHKGLAHHIHLRTGHLLVRAGEAFEISISVKNTGDARWLAENDGEIFGVVRIGTHLLDGTGRLRSIDFTRHPLRHDVEPSESIDTALSIRLVEPGAFRIVIDLVAEGVTWFENAGSSPVAVDITVSEGVGGDRAPRT
jgi:SAM-dependent methyltransferase